EQAGPISGMPVRIAPVDADGRLGAGRVGPGRGGAAVRPRGGSGAEAEEVLHGQLLQAHEAEVALAGLVRVEVLERGAVREQVREGLALGEGRLCELLDA